MCQAFLFYFYALQYPHVSLLKLKIAVIVRACSYLLQKVDLLSYKFDLWQFGVDHNWSNEIAQNLIAKMQQDKERELKENINKKLAFIDMKSNVSETWTISDYDLHKCIH